MPLFSSTDIMYETAAPCPALMVKLSDQQVKKSDCQQQLLHLLARLATRFS